MKFVRENLYEEDTEMGQQQAIDPVIAQKLANGQAALNREDLKLQALKDKMIPINKRKAQIQKAMIKAQEENAKNVRAQAKEQIKQQKQIKVAQETQQQTTAQNPIATPIAPALESLLQSDLDQIELLEDRIVVLMQTEKPDYKKINKLIEELKTNTNTKIIEKNIQESENPMSKDVFYNLSEAFEDLEKKTKIEDEYVFYIKVYNDDEWFIGKIFKNDPIEDWYGIVKAGEDDTFEKISYDPEYDKDAIVDFLKDTYDKVEIIDKAEYNDYAEKHPKDLDEEGGITGMHL